MFTHQGRLDVLAEGLQSVLVQIDDSRLSDVEICLTDNASHDGTEQLVSELKAGRGRRLRYMRHDRDLGLSANLLACVAMARADYCWILTSDDVLEPGAVARAIELVEATGEPPGVIVGKANFDFTMTQPTGQGGPDFYPPEHSRTIQYEDAETFLKDCGLLASLVSTLIVRRERWLAAVEELGGGDRLARTTIFPHLPVLASIAKHDPRWVWCPAKLVRARMGNAFMASDEGLSIEQIHVRLLGDMSRMWASRLSTKRRVRHALMRRAYRTFATPEVLRAIAPNGRSVRRRAALTLAYTPIFWWLPEFWLRSVPALVSEGASRSWSKSTSSRPVLAIDQRRARIQPVDTQHEVPDSHEIEIVVRVENASSATFWPDALHRIVIGYRWVDRNGEVRLQGPAIRLPRKLTPRQSCITRLNLLTPSEPGAYTLRVALAQEDVGWFDDNSADFSYRQRVEVRRYGWTDLP